MKTNIPEWNHGHWRHGNLRRQIISSAEIREQLNLQVHKGKKNNKKSRSCKKCLPVGKKNYVIGNLGGTSSVLGI